MSLSTIGRTLALLCACVLFTNSVYANDNLPNRFSAHIEDAKYQSYLASKQGVVFEEDVPVFVAPDPQPPRQAEPDHYEGRQIPCTVTAYYSPLRGQRKYQMGSYLAELRMEGNGTNGADGTPIFKGMIAAGRQHAFGTRIYIPDFGVGEVHDRGGAIRGKGRIDVWLGYGDEGREKAMAWGKRKLTCVVID